METKESKVTWTVEAVGTERGRSVIFLRGSDMSERIIPTDNVSMARLAEIGVRVRNIA